MWGAIADLQLQFEADEDLIEYKGKKNLALYTGFFPDGRRKYTRASLLTDELLLRRAATAHAILGTAYRNKAPNVIAVLVKG